MTYYLSTPTHFYSGTARNTLHLNFIYLKRINLNQKKYMKDALKKFTFRRECKCSKKVSMTVRLLQ